MGFGVKPTNTDNNDGDDGVGRGPFGSLCIMGWQSCAGFCSLAARAGPDPF